MRKEAFFMPIKNIRRKVVLEDTKGKFHASTYHERQYIKHHSKGYQKMMDAKRYEAIIIQHAQNEVDRLLHTSASNFKRVLANCKHVASIDNAPSDKKVITPELPPIKGKLTKAQKHNLKAKQMDALTNTLKSGYKIVRPDKSSKDRHVRVSATSILGISALTDDSGRQNLQLARKDLKFWHKVLRNHAQQAIKNPDGDDSIIHTLRAVLSIDTEWLARPGLNPRESLVSTDPNQPTTATPDDVINFSFAIWFPDYPDKYIKGVILNETHEGFNYKQFMNFIIDEIESKLRIPGKVLDLTKLDLMLTGYFLGVDFSKLKGWNKIRNDIVVIHKNYIFSQPFPTIIKDWKELQHSGQGRSVKIITTIRDSGLLAPMGGLKKLGEMIGLSKIDTEEWDKRDGLSIGYYKTHMTEFLRNHPHEFYEYAIRDALTPIKYLQLYARTLSGVSFKTFNKFPQTVSNYAMQQVLADLDSQSISQRIFDPNKSKSDWKSDPLHSVRPGLVEFYSDAQLSYFGGFNVAFFSGALFHVNVVDTDLTSAYNVGGNLMSRPDYTQPISSNLNDLYKRSVLISHYKGTFKELYARLQAGKGFPFLIGTVIADVDYPDNYDGICLTPYRSKKTDNPTYVKHIHNAPVNIVDAIDAFEHGATINVHSLTIPAQNWNDANAWAKGQQAFLALRNQAKKKRDSFSKNSAEYLEWDAKQTLFKLHGNTIYGKSSQSVRPKRSRNLNTDETEDIEISSITDPLIASSFTAITRYLVHQLYDAVKHTYGNGVMPLNITTDGYTFALHGDVQFDFEAVNKVFSSNLSSFYHDRLHELGFSVGFERKAVGDDVLDNNPDKPVNVFNMRTRFNATPTDKRRVVIEALGGIQEGTFTSYDVFQAIQKGITTLHVNGTKLSNLSEIKWGAKNHLQGVMYEEHNWRNIPLQYDCSYQPCRWLSDNWKGFGFTAIPFATVSQHDTWKAHSKLLTDRYDVTTTRVRFNDYLKTMESYNFNRNDLLDLPAYQAKVNYCLAKIKGQQVATIRKYKDVLYKFKKSLQDGKKSTICLMAKYHNQLFDYQYTQLVNSLKNIINKGGSND